MAGSGPYVVEIKPSARRINRAASEWVGRRSVTRAFGTKTEAREWARTISSADGAVRVQDAAPNDPADVDGYLVANPARRGAGGTRVKRSSRDESSTLDRFEPTT